MNTVTLQINDWVLELPVDKYSAGSFVIPTDKYNLFIKHASDINFKPIIKDWKIDNVVEDLLNGNRFIKRCSVKWEERGERYLDVLGSDNNYVNITICNKENETLWEFNPMIIKNSKGWKYIDEWDELPIGTFLVKLDQDRDPYHVAVNKGNCIVVGGRFHYDYKEPILKYCKIED